MSRRQWKQRKVRHDAARRAGTRGTESTMATLTVWKFHTTRGAAEAEETLIRLQEQGLIVGQDAAIVYSD
jgi:hypothetical protein